jgi:hypothetical protein
MQKKINIENHGKTFMFSGGVIFTNNNELFTRKGNNIVPLVFTNRLNNTLPTITLETYNGHGKANPNCRNPILREV